MGLLAGPGGGVCWATSILANASTTAWLSWDSGTPALDCASKLASTTLRGGSALPETLVCEGAWLLALASLGVWLAGGVVRAVAAEDTTLPGDGDLS